MEQAHILDGKRIAQERQDALQHKLNTQNITPHLAVVLVGEDAASQLYVQRKQQTAQSIGIKTSLIRLDANTTTQSLCQQIQHLNEDSSVHGILVQLPLPPSVDTPKIIETIAHEKDVDGFHPYHQGRLAIGKPSIMPCTALGIIQLIEAYAIPIRGQHVVMIGTSTIVGMPTALALTHKKATVTLCHSETKALSSQTQQADILISATGKHHLIQAGDIKPGAVVIDVGIHRLESGKIVGDVDYEQVKAVASWITPVPGGVGPMTVAALMENTYLAASQQIS